MYCFDTDVLSAVLRRDPPLHLIRRLAQVPPTDQATMTISLGELLYGAAKRGSERTPTPPRSTGHCAPTSSVKVVVSMSPICASHR
jgi:hypothetical protein